jgi:DNA-binding GntR family transcriptional regulator
MAAEQIVRQSLHESLVAPLRDMILRGELRAGEKVPEEQLCERFGVSRTPIREALKVLAAEGVLQIQPHRGAIVARITEDEINQLFPIMASLERLAGRLACAVATDDDVSRVRALHDDMVAHSAAGDEAAYLQLNRQIHDAFFAIAGNTTLRSFYQQILTRIHSSRFVTQKTPEYWRIAVLEHEQMIAALAARDGETLGSLLERHITGTTVAIARDDVRSREAEAQESGSHAKRRGGADPAPDFRQAQP